MRERRHVQHIVYLQRVCVALWPEVNGACAERSVLGGVTLADGERRADGGVVTEALLVDGDVV